VPSDTVKPPRIAQARAAFECGLERIVAVSEGADAGNLILGRVKLLHVSDDLISADGRSLDPLALDALGRLSGAGYCAVERVIVSEKN
jgi:flavin reductase (DIM6/NTAB) family NADH-FMN oxidoreductase RutF